MNKYLFPLITKDGDMIDISSVIDSSLSKNKIKMFMMNLIMINMNLSLFNIGEGILKLILNILYSLFFIISKRLFKFFSK